MFHGQIRQAAPEDHGLPERTGMPTRSVQGHGTLGELPGRMRRGRHLIKNNNNIGI